MIAKRSELLHLTRKSHHIFPALSSMAFQEPKLEVPTIYKAEGNIPAKYGLIWYSTSILGSWNSIDIFATVLPCLDIAV